jgi:hypothetical protein
LAECNCGSALGPTRSLYTLYQKTHDMSARRDPRDWLEGVLHFFEATAQFGCAVLLSILRANPDLLAFVRPELVRVVGRRADLFDRAEFGRWIKLGKAPAEAIGHISEKRELRPRLEEAAGPAAGLVTQLAGERIWRVLDQARGKRNIRAHGGVLPLTEMESRIVTLQALSRQLGPDSRISTSPMPNRVASHPA